MTTPEIEVLLKKYYPEAFSEPDTLGFRLLQFGIEVHNKTLDDAAEKAKVEWDFAEYGPNKVYTVDKQSILKLKIK